jgi:hypothetical protein
LQKNNILWEKETKYEIWEEINEQDEVSNKFLEYNIGMVRVNVVINEQETTSKNTEETIPPQPVENNIPIEEEAPVIRNISVDRTK